MGLFERTVKSVTEFFLFRIARTYKQPIKQNIPVVFPFLSSFFFLQKTVVYFSMWKMSWIVKIRQYVVRSEKNEKPTWFYISFTCIEVPNKMRLKIKLDSVQFKCDWSQSVFDIGTSLGFYECRIHEKINLNHHNFCDFSFILQLRHNCGTQNNTYENFSRTKEIGSNEEKNR